MQDYMSYLETLRQNDALMQSETERLRVLEQVCVIYYEQACVFLNTYVLFFVSENNQFRMIVMHIYILIINDGL